MNLRWWSTALLMVALGLGLGASGFAADTPAASVQPWGVSLLMQGLAAHQPRQANYVEEKYLGVLDTPLISSGSLIYRAPDYLEKRTRAPRPAVMTLSGETLTLTEDSQTQTLDLTAHPDAAEYVNSIRGLLSGNLALLRKTFSLQLTGDRNHWTLLLRPAGGRIGGMIDSISVTGSGDIIRRLEYDESDGDRSIMTIQPKARP